MSPTSARVAESIGFTNVRVFHAGMPAWKKAKGLMVSEPGYIKQMRKDGVAFVLVDLRAAGDAAKGHIPGAVAIAAGKLGDARARFPEDKSAPIILYAAEGIDADAFATVRGWGYRNVSVMRGGLAGWKKAGGAVSTYKLATDFEYVKVLPKNQVSIEEFKQVADTQPAGKVILDVRDASAAEQGMIKGAVNIPQAELGARMGELPKDRELLIYCNTGILASMARDALTKAGYRARFLDAIVQVDADGSYEVTEK